MHSFIVVPLRAQGQIVGALHLSRDEPGQPYTTDDLALVQGIADRAALAVQNALLFEDSQRALAARREAEAEVRRLNAELEQRVLTRTAELQSANREMEAFSYSVSHDLRSPLRAIDGYLALLVERCCERLDGEEQRLLDTARRNARHMGRLVDDLLDFSRTGRSQLHSAPVNMDRLAREALGEVLQLERANVDMDLHALAPAAGDDGLLRQVFVNLIGNAVKFSRPKGSIRVEIGGYAGNDGRRTVYYVKDNGVGFDMDYVHKLFGVFQRLHGADDFEGTGIGLAMVKRIVERHGGRVWAESTLGEAGPMEPAEGVARPWASPRLPGKSAARRCGQPVASPPGGRHPHGV